MFPRYSAFLGSALVVLASLPAIALAAKHPAAPSRLSWVIHAGGRVFQRSWDGSPKERLSKAEKARIAAIAKAKLGAEAMFIVEDPVSPISANNLVPIDPDRDCAGSTYCRSIDSITNAARALLADCQIVDPSIISTMPWRQLGIDRACVGKHARTALDLATDELNHGRIDRNVDWISGALNLLSACKMMPFTRDATYCDAFDVDVRLSFISDLFEDLKTHPRPLKELVTARIYGEGEKPGPESVQKPLPFVESGEFVHYRTRPSDLPGRIVVKFPDQVNAFALPSSNTLEMIALDSLRSKCQAKGATLVESPEEEAPRIGFLDAGSDVFAFYEGNCQPRN